MRGELINVDPESEREFGERAKAISWELQARLAVHDPVDTPEAIDALAELVADTVLDRFVVRKRTDDTPRYDQAK